MELNRLELKYKYFMCFMFFGLEQEVEMNKKLEEATEPDARQVKTMNKTTTTNLKHDKNSFSCERNYFLLDLF